MEHHHRVDARGVLFAEKKDDTDSARARARSAGMIVRNLRWGPRAPHSTGAVNTIYYYIAYARPVTCTSLWR